MKKNLMTLAAVLCCAFSVTVGLTSCSQSDNPVEPQPVEPPVKQVAMADVVTLDGARQSLYKLDTKEVLPFYIAVNSAYKDEQGETQFYDLSTITEVKVNDDMFLVDATHLADNGYIKLTPDPNSQEFKDILEDIEFVEASWWSTGVKIELTNNRGEKLEAKVPLDYYPKNEQKDVLNIKMSDLNENNEIELEPAIIKQFNLSDWPNQRTGDFVYKDMNDLRDVKITDDGKLIVRVWDYATEPDTENKLTLTFTRTLTGSPIPMLPEGEGLMINFRYELELNITE
jgi:hypothetical protein